MTREGVLAEVARRLLEREVGHPLRVGIDGICGAGKSTLARELAAALEPLGRPVLHLDSDGFHHTLEIRYRQGRESARGYYEDAYDFDSLRDLTLVPLGPKGSLRCATRIHDLETDEVVREWVIAPADAVVLFDATFLQRGGLRGHWDEVVWVDVTVERAQRRGVARDSEALGGLDAAELAYSSRYMAACRLYLHEQNPRAAASMILDNEDPANPRLL